jgi:predicted DCC family thiol-disulfide oxidoreductase YuxK
MSPSPVIYFDGVCNLCTTSVQFVLKRDKKNIFRFASLQGEAGQKMLESHHMPTHHYKSFVVEEGGKIFTRSTGALRVFKHLGGAWSLMYAFILVPPFIRDAIYNYVSEHRFRWFGKKESCWLPRPEWKQRFLD